MSKRNNRNKSNGNKKMAGRVVSAPVATAQNLTTRSPSIKMVGNKKVVTHCELLAEIPAEAAWSVLAYDINPGLITSFPWLEQEARGWEQYCIKRLVYHYKPLITTQSSGSVVLGIDYDPTDPPPNSKAEMMTYIGAESTVPWSRATVEARTQLMHRRNGALFLRSGPTPENLKWFDAGTFYVGTQGMLDVQAAQSLGEIIVEYTVEFYGPQRPSGLQVPQNLAQFGYTDGTASPISQWTSVPYDQVIINGPGVEYEFLGPGIYNWTLPNGTWRVDAGLGVRNTSLSTGNWCIELRSTANGTTKNLGRADFPGDANANVFGWLDSSDVIATTSDGSDTVYNVEYRLRGDVSTADLVFGGHLIYTYLLSKSSDTSIYQGFGPTRYPPITFTSFDKWARIMRKCKPEIDSKELHARWTYRRGQSEQKTTRVPSAPFVEVTHECSNCDSSDKLSRSDGRGGTVSNKAPFKGPATR